MKFDLHNTVSSKYAQWIIIALIVLFSVLIIGEYLTLLPSTKSVVQDAGMAIPKKKPEDASNYILDASLFGVYMPNDLNEGNVKQSSLNLTLVGILLGNTPEDSQVIIRDAGGEEQTFTLGDKIPGGALIKKITAHGVLVERNGTLERLSLPKNDLIFEPVAKPLKQE